ncbi:Exonuclease SbcC [Hyella patelloides LEGE 07179]|uniref:Nuclease SbcCD subunit C n=1 Tax=Hyella patelloides LEGE 07179 TaxID=945734 RepID=A0A563VSA3_9CYAN|nr:exonuclease subunit SbcC [Hyella patelloides]VEP14169.1 Exonuclease SbcC [Hyella patelloides LEGE 07179]
MIPLQITLKNFLSYRETSLDFRGLHTACICGSNGAGKSSLLEAITWVVWGKTRAATEDDVIHNGAKNVRVDFEFICNNQTYRVIRSRPRGRSGSLEFQIATESGRFRSLTAKGIKATQTEIIACLKLDYDTFINSAYLRQGRADEFMLRRPSDRKQVLADLLKLDRYEELASKAKDSVKEYKGRVEQLEQSVTPLLAEIAQRKVVSQELQKLELQVASLQENQNSDRKQLQQLQTIDHQRQAIEQQFTWQQNQHQNLIKDCDRLIIEINSLEQQQQQLTQLLEQEASIVQGYQQLLTWQQSEKDFAHKFSRYQQLEKQKQLLNQQLLKQKNELNLEIKQTQTRLENIEQQEQEIQDILSRSGEITTALEKLDRSRRQLKELDKRQQYVSPLLQRKNNLQTEIAKEKANLTAKLDQLQISVYQLENEISQVPQMRNAVLTVDAQIGELDKKKTYQKRLEEKGLEKRSCQERLQENQRNYEKQWQELQQKLEMLSVPDAVCPLCEQGLEEHHRYHVVNKTQQQQESVKEQIWIIRERLATCEKELQVYRQEYRAISQDLHEYNNLRQRLGHLEAQLEATEDTYEKLEAAEQEKNRLELSLSSGNYAQELQIYLQQLNEELQILEYDEQTHALVRGEVDRWRWAEIKQAKIEDARKRQAKLSSQKPQLIAKISTLETATERLAIDSEIQQQINQIEDKINSLGYEQSQHQHILDSLRQAQSWHLQYQQLQQAQQQYPQLETKKQELNNLLQLRTQDKVTSQEQLDNYLAQREQVVDYRNEIQTLEQQITQRRYQLDDLISRSGSLKESLVQIDKLTDQHKEIEQQLKDTKKKYRIYQELAQAFGKNGIQALTIENILPQLEAETNQILARLTGNQFHVQFLTQKATKGTSKKKTKLIDTLDILIADAQGTRPYETYSGGEAFRINFSIRLALAKLLAQRSGTSLQMLIVDEGFGTQDPEGCNRLIASINAIASDFACILAVTHMSQFKEAFQTRIEVFKGDKGSVLKVNN